MDLTGTVNLARELEDAFRGRRLARVDVGKNADIPVCAEICHFSVSIFFILNLQRLALAVLPGPCLVVKSERVPVSICWLRSGSDGPFGRG
jgi:hypothetical protein